LAHLKSGRGLPRISLISLPFILEYYELLMQVFSISGAKLVIR
jgi:hypothetical protein